MMRVPATATVPIDHQMPMLTTLDRHFISMMVLRLINLLYLFIYSNNKTYWQGDLCMLALLFMMLVFLLYNLYEINE